MFRSNVVVIAAVVALNGFAACSNNVAGDAQGDTNGTHENPADADDDNPDESDPSSDDRDDDGGSMGDGDDTTSISSEAIKFNPGHYTSVDGIIYAQNGGSCAPTPSCMGLPEPDRKANALSVINAAGEANVVGVEVSLTWAVLEGPTAGDYSAGFELLDQLLAAAAANNKHLMIQIPQYQVGYWGEPDISWPAYLRTSTYGSLGTPNYDTYFRYGATAVIPTMQPVLALWEAPVMDRLIALVQAYGARYDSNPYLEMVSPMTDQATNTFYSSHGFSVSAMSTQLARLYIAARAAFPHTALRLWIDYFGSDAQNAATMQAALASGWSIGGNDVLPAEDVAANTVFNGEVEGTDYRGKVPWVSFVATPELCGKEGTWTPSQLFSAAMDGNEAVSDNGMRPMWPQYFVWIRNTWACLPSDGYTGAQLWSYGDVGMLQYINSINGAISNGRDSTLRSSASVKEDYCPSGYVGGCK